MLTDKAKEIISGVKSKMEDSVSERPIRPSSPM